MKEINYIPSFRKMPERVAPVATAWHPNEEIVEALIKDFGIEQNNALELGVDWGFSLIVLSGFFKEILGVDLHTSRCVEVVKQFSNIKLLNVDYSDFIIKNINNYYNLIHIDLTHTYFETIEAGLWAVKHSDMAIFHDTGVVELKQALEEIADMTGKTFYNFNERHGLGIITDFSLKAI